EVARRFTVDQEQVVGARTAGNVDVLAQLDIAVGPEHGEPPIAPGRQSVGRVPVEAGTAAALVVSPQHLAETREAVAPRDGEHARDWKGGGRPGCGSGGGRSR